jgi:hypothetical protein
MIHTPNGEQACPSEDLQQLHLSLFDIVRGRYPAENSIFAKGTLQQSRPLRCEKMFGKGVEPRKIREAPAKKQSLAAIGQSLFSMLNVRDAAH